MAYVVYPNGWGMSPPFSSRSRKKTLDNAEQVVYIFLHTARDVDGDSTLYGKAKASRGMVKARRCEVQVKIPPESCGRTAMCREAIGQRGTNPIVGTGSLPLPGNV